MSEIPPSWTRFSINESDIVEHDRVYLNYLEAVRQPVSYKLWSEFSNIETFVLEELVEKYNIPTKLDPKNEIKIVPISITNTTEVKSHSDIAKNLLEKWKNRKSQSNSDE